MKKLSSYIGSVTKLPLRRLIAIFVMVSTVLLLIALFCYYFSFYRASLRASYEFMDNTLSDTNSRVTVLLNKVSSSMLNLAYSEDMYIDFVSASSVQKFEKNNVINTMLNSMSDNDSLIDNISIWFKNGQILSSDNLSNSIGQYLIMNSLIKDYKLSEPFQHVLLTRCYTEVGTSNVYFACMVPIYNTVGGARSADRYLGSYIALCNARNLVDLQNSATSSIQPAIVIAEGDSIIYSNNPELASGLIKSISETDGANGPVNVGKSVYQIRTATVETTGWRLLCAVSDVELHTGLNQIRVWGIILTISVILVQLLMGYTLRLSIVKPLSNIVKQIHSVGTEERPTTLTIPDSSEIGILAGDIAEMLKRIERMNANMMNATKALFEAENNRLEAHIMFLQVQINPHYLYNNLECVRGMATAGKMNVVREMVSEMAAVYRYCISAGQIVTLREELDIARQFFSIITLRYGNRYVMDIAVPEEMKNRPIPKMTLQPILENAFLHGLAGITKGGAVRIKGDMDPMGEVILSVSDNGHGMCKNVLHEMNQQLLLSESSFRRIKSTGIGIFNVNSRIRLIFGDDYGVSLQPNMPQGLCILIRLGQKIKNGLAQEANIL